MEFFNFALGEKDYETKTLLVSPDGNTEDDIPSGWNTLLEVDPLANDDGIDDWKAKMDHEYVLIRIAYSHVSFCLTHLKVHPLKLI